MTWATVAVAGSALIGSGLSYLSANKSANSASQASQAQIQAAQQAQRIQLGIYNQTRNDLSPYNLTGQHALNALSAFMGLPSSPVTAGLPFDINSATSGNADSAKTLANIRQGLQSWSSALPGNAEPIIKMIDGGASLQQVQSALSSLRATTTSPQNTAFLDPLIQQANNPVSLPLQALGGQSGMGAGGTPNNFNPSAILQNWPGYQFMRDQGLQAIDRQNAAGGRFLSGAQMKDSAKFGSDYALAGAVSPYLGQLNDMTHLGENAGAMVGNAGIQTGQGVAGSLMAGGTAAASGFAGQANAFNQGAGGINTAIQGALNNQLFSNMLGGGGGNNALYSYGSGTGAPGSWSDFGYAY